jgi:hypothetical protein
MRLFHWQAYANGYGVAKDMPTAYEGDCGPRSVMPGIEYGRVLLEAVTLGASELLALCGRRTARRVEMPWATEVAHGSAV